jgi:predicted phage tail protein
MLYGFLGDKFGKVHRYDVSSPAEAVRALSATLKGFKQSLVDGGYYRVLLGGKSDLELDQTINPTSDRETIRIVPVVAGSGGMTKIVLGAALIAFSLYFPGVGLVIGSTTYGTASIITSVGISLVLGGVSQMLFKPPKAPDSAESEANKPSFIFNGAVNTSKQGNAVPVCYGRMVVGSQVISAGLSVSAI